MRIRETNTLCCHLVQPGCLIGSLRVVAGQVAVPQIVSVDDDDVGEFLRIDCFCTADKKNAGNETRQKCSEMHTKNSRGVWVWVWNIQAANDNTMGRVGVR